jgi:hypothetical protein
MGTERTMPLYGAESSPFVELAVTRMYEPAKPTSRRRSATSSR